MRHGRSPQNRWGKTVGANGHRPPSRQVPVTVGTPRSGKFLKSKHATPRPGSIALFKRRHHRRFPVRAFHPSTDFKSPAIHQSSCPVVTPDTKSRFRAKLCWHF
ncbi:hypothetical protein [Azospirillum largimobile]